MDKRPDPDHKRVRRTVRAKVALRKPTQPGAVSAPIRPAAAIERRALGGAAASPGDPLLRHLASQAGPAGLCAFLLTHAAMQRGFAVSFLYGSSGADAASNVLDCDTSGAPVFTLNDGVRSVTFCGAHPVAPDPDLIDGQPVVTVGKFLLPGPSLAMVDSDPAPALAETRPAQQCYRALIVDGQCLGVISRSPPSVVGDGQATIRALIARKNQSRSEGTIVGGGPIREFQAISEQLVAMGLAWDHIPPAGMKITLLNTLDPSRGAEGLALPAPAPPAVERAALAACAVSRHAVAAIDLGVIEAGENPDLRVLSIDPRPRIGELSLSMTGAGRAELTVADALLAYHFPGALQRHCHAALVFDFANTVGALLSAQAAALSLPVAPADWRVIRLTESGINAKPFNNALRAAARETGVYVTAAGLVPPTLQICLAGPAAGVDACYRSMPVAMRERWRAATLSD